jgi:hypothetical protein
VPTGPQGSAGPDEATGPQGPQGVAGPPTDQAVIAGLQLQNDILRLSVAKTLSVTSPVHRGNFGGLVSGDAICNARAKEVGLMGEYKVWLSTSTASPRTLFNQARRLPHLQRPYVMPNGAVVADSYADLTDGTLLSLINTTEAGTPSGGGQTSVWTGTSPEGTVFKTQFMDSVGALLNATCLDWLSIRVSTGGQIGITTSTARIGRKFPRIQTI